MALPATPERISDLVARLLDRGYERASSAVIGAVVRSTNSGVVARRLDELAAEAVRLAEAGERLTPDNPVLRALTADLEAALRRDARALNQAAEGVQQSGASAAEQLTPRLLVGGQDLPLLGMAWNTPDPEAVNALVNYANNPAWAMELERYAPGMVETVNNAAIRGFFEGWGPRRIANEVRRLVQEFPAFQANNLLRTLQLQSYRDATAIHQTANNHILEGQIRIAARDDRTCLCCIALHGTFLPVGARVEDHHQGRCTSIGVVRGRMRDIQTGEQWFNELPEARQLAIAGPGKLAALQAGDVRLADFVQPYSDPVFGMMLREGSLQRALGRAA